MIPYLVIGGVLCGWTMLSLLGSERKRRLVQAENQRRIEEMLQQQNRTAAPPDPAQAPSPGKPPDPHKSVR